MKFAILLCVIVFACLTQAQQNDEPVAIKTRNNAFIESAKAKLELIKTAIVDVIDNASTILQETISQAKDKANDLIEKLKQGSTNINNKVYESVMEILDAFNGDVKKLEEFARSKGVNISECTQMTKTLRQAALDIIANSSACLVTKIEKGQDLLQNMMHDYGEVKFDLKEIKDNSSKCIEKIDDVKAVIDAVGCVNLAGAEAYWAVAKKVPRATFDAAKMTFLISILPPSLIYCASVNSIMTFHEDSNYVFNSINMCVDARVKEAMKPTTGSPDATEASEATEATVDTEAPDAIEAPEYTKASEVTEAHQNTKATEASEHTEVSEANKAFYSIEDPEVIENIDPTEDPEVTATSDYTDDPEVTETSDHTEDPDVTDASDHTKATEPTENP